MRLPWGRMATSSSSTWASRSGSLIWPATSSGLPAATPTRSRWRSSGSDRARSSTRSSSTTKSTSSRQRSRRSCELPPSRRRTHVRDDVRALLAMATGGREHELRAALMDYALGSSVPQRAIRRRSIPVTPSRCYRPRPATRSTGCDRALNREARQEVRFLLSTPDRNGLPVTRSNALATVPPGSGAWTRTPPSPRASSSVRSCVRRPGQDRERPVVDRHDVARRRADSTARAASRGPIVKWPPIGRNASCGRVELADQRHVAEHGRCRPRSRSGTRSRARRRSRPARRGRAVVSPPGFQSPAEWSAWIIVTLIPATSNVPPLFIPIGRVRPTGQPAARATGSSRGCTARPAAAGWRARPRRPCGRRGRGSRACRSQRSTESAVRGLRGLPKPRIDEDGLAAGRPDLEAGVAVPGERRVADRDPWWTPPGAMLQRGYTRAVPATQIAQNLAFINWTVLTGLALGSYAAVVLLRRRTTATPGYLRFTASVRARVRRPGLDLGRGAAEHPRRLAGRGRPGLGRAATRRAAAVLRPGRGLAGRPTRRRAGRGQAVEWAARSAPAVATLAVRRPGVGRRVARRGRRCSSSWWSSARPSAGCSRR